MSQDDAYFHIHQNGPGGYDGDGGGGGGDGSGWLHLGGLTADDCSEWVDHATLPTDLDDPT